MAKDAQSDIIQLVAIETGFVKGHLVYPGVKFDFYTHDKAGKKRKLPKWAQLADLPLPKKVTAINGDLKPKDAQKAVGVKRAELAGATPDGSADSVDAKGSTDLA